MAAVSITATMTWVPDGPLHFRVLRWDHQASPYPTTLVWADLPPDLCRQGGPGERLVEALIWAFRIDYGTIQG